MPAFRKCKYVDFYGNILYFELPEPVSLVNSIFDTMVYVVEVVGTDKETYLMEKDFLIDINNIELYLYY